MFIVSLTDHNWVEILLFISWWTITTHNAWTWSDVDRRRKMKNFIQLINVKGDFFNSFVFHVRLHMFQAHWMERRKKNS